MVLHVFTLKYNDPFARAVNLHMRVWRNMFVLLIYKPGQRCRQKHDSPDLSLLIYILSPVCCHLKNNIFKDSQQAQFNKLFFIILECMYSMYYRWLNKHKFEQIVVLLFSDPQNGGNNRINFLMTHCKSNFYVKTQIILWSVVPSVGKKSNY